MRSRSVHFLDTCEKRNAAQCQLRIFPAGETRFFLEVITGFHWQSAILWEIPDPTWSTQLDESRVETRAWEEAVANRFLPANPQENWQQIWIKKNGLQSFRFWISNEIESQMMYCCCIFVTWYCIYSVSNNFKKVYCYLCVLCLFLSCDHVLSFCRLSFTMLQCDYFSIQDWVWMH